MPITSVTKDLAGLTLTVVADYPVPQARRWDAFADPRQLERFWGPPTWPATFTRHDMNDPNMPSSMKFTFEATPTGSRLTCVTHAERSTSAAHG